MADARHVVEPAIEVRLKLSPALIRSVQQGPFESYGESRATLARLIGEEALQSAEGLLREEANVND